ncbi:MAG: Holliday junction branch migration protein RuvA [Anaerolineales bacterium]|nr:Holliday junction branch migration protein RuvA [Anaerolineales bacterium]
MIDIIAGQVVAEGDNYLVVMVGGVGIRVYVSRSARQQIDHSNYVTLHTHLIVREDALTLYGFADEEERGLFVVLLGVTGVGPRLAITILSTLSRDQLQGAIGQEKPDVLTRVPGIGKKTAQKIVFELKDKLGASFLDQLVPINDIDSDVIATLTALGYSVVEAQTALQSIPADAPQEVEERVRLALQYFA